MEGFSAETWKPGHFGKPSLGAETVLSLTVGSDKTKTGCKAVVCWLQEELAL